MMKRTTVLCIAYLSAFVSMGCSPAAPRTVNLVGMAGQPPANFTQPPSNGSYKPQWLLIAVASVTSP